jgi:O-antigen/teichoic acid export membrane protein
MVWFLLGTGLTRGLSFGSQWILGLLLSHEDYGIYAVAMSFGVFGQFIRDGGGRQLLIQRGKAEYPRLAGSVFWLGMMFSGAAGLALAAASPLVAHAYGDPRYIPMMILIGLSIPLNAPGAVPGAKLLMDLRAGPLTVVQTLSAVIRYGGAVALALLGFGPLSWAWPLVALALFESIAYTWAAGDVSWLARPNTAVWREVLRTGIWVMAVALAIVTLTQGAYVAVGRFASADTTGIFFFAFQIVLQIEAVIGINLQELLFPALVRLNAEPQRQQAAILRSLGALMFIAAPAGVAIALLFAPLEQMLWHGKWAAAVLPVQILALLMGARILYVVPNAVLQARGRFKRLSFMLALVGLASMVAAAVGALSDDPTRVSLWVGGSLGVACLTFCIVALQLVGVGIGSFVAEIAPPWGVAVLGGLVVWGADRAVLHALPAPARFLSLGVSYAVLFWCGARLALPHQIDEVVQFVPARLRGPISRVLGGAPRQAAT